MEENKSISLNHFGEFYTAPKGRKQAILNIVKKKFDGSHPFWYTLSKSRIRKTLSTKSELTFISDTIEEVLKRKAPSDWHRTNDRGNLEILQRFLKLRFYKNLKEMGYEVIPTDIKSFDLNGLSIDVKPDIVYYVERNNIRYLGAIVLRYNKGKAFKPINGQLVAEGIKMYLEQEIAIKDDIVLPELCLSVDIFSETVVSAINTDSKHRKILYDLSEEIRERLSA